MPTIPGPGSSRCATRGRTIRKRGGDGGPGAVGAQDVAELDISGRFPTVDALKRRNDVGQDADASAWSSAGPTAAK
jgi:hypothetical protein